VPGDGSVLAAFVGMLRERTRMVHQLETRGIRDPVVLAAFDQVPREQFVAPHLAAHAYEDRPLPIEAEQTISQPHIVAVMVQALELVPDSVVLEVGTGSGYAAAILACIASHVYTIERQPQLAQTARSRLARLGFFNVDVRCGDGTLGWEQQAPFDAIVVSAGGPVLPQALVDQLAVGGRLVMPIGDATEQRLIRVTKVSASELRQEDLGAVVFVPLIGAQGWEDACVFAV